MKFINALVVKLVDTKDLNPYACECQFESGRGQSKWAQIICDKNKKSLSIKNLLLNKIKSNQFKKENLIIVIGGDGFKSNTKKIKI